MAHVPSIQLRSIESLDDLIDAMELCDTHEVPFDGLESLDEIKDRLKCHYWVQKHGNYKQTVSKSIMESGEDDEVKRKQLIDILEQITVVTGLEGRNQPNNCSLEGRKQPHNCSLEGRKQPHNSSLEDTSDVEEDPASEETFDADSRSLAADMLDEFLYNEGTSTDLHGDCKKRILNLQNGECVILIAGEAAAGKTSVLNLLLEECIIPPFWWLCMPPITTVRYGQRSARIIYEDVAMPTEELKLDEEGMKKFNDLVLHWEDGHQIREVQLYLPLWFLRTGLVLAEIPCISETEFLERYLIKYISENQILGFIYVIMSDAAGGVREDRLLLLLKIIIEGQRNKQHSLPFDPRATLFVCNRIDLIQEDQWPTVKFHILEQLGKFWPEFQPAQAVFFSTANAQRDINAHPDYINAEYRLLLDSIKRLFCVAMDRRIRSSYNWAETLLQRIIHFLKTMVKFTSIPDRDCQDNSKAIRRKLQTLGTKTNTVVLTLRTEIRETAVQIGNGIKKILQKPRVKFLLCSAWKPGEIPTLSETVKSISHWYWVKERVDTAFYDRLCDILVEDWGQENCNIREIESKMVDDIRAKLGVLEEEILDVEQDMHRSDSESNPGGGRATSTTGTMRQLSLRSLSSGITVCNAPAKLHLKAQLRISQNKGLFENTKARRNSMDFKTNPQIWARERAEKLYEKLRKENTNTVEVIYSANDTEGASRLPNGGELEKLVLHLLQRPLDLVDAIEEIVPIILKANEMLLRSIETMRPDKKKKNATFETIMNAIEDLRTSLKGTSLGTTSSQTR